MQKYFRKFILYYEIFSNKSLNLYNLLFILFKFSYLKEIVFNSIFVWNLILINRNPK